jgi:tetratricopeptide (TPR) repeat protein
MNKILFLLISRMKNFLLCFFITVLLFSCNSGVEKRDETGSSGKLKENNSLSIAKEEAPAVPQNVQQPIQTQPTPAGKLNAAQVQNQTNKSNPVKRDPKDPNNYLLNAYGNNKINSAVPAQPKESDPNLLAARDFLISGTNKAKDGNQAGAIEDFTKSIELSKTPGVYLRRGYSYLLLKEYKLAVIDLSEAIKLAPTIDRPYFARGVCHFEMQEFKQADEDFTKYLKTDKTSALAFNYMAATKFMQKKFQDALDNYNEVVKLDPAFPDIYTNRGMMRHNLGDLLGAIQDYDMAIKQDPSNSSAYNNKGAAELRLKEYPAALSDLNNAIRINANYVDAYENRGKVKINLGDIQGACDDFKKAYSMGNASAQELIIKYCE